MPAVQESNVAGAVIVQPSEAHHFDDSYVSDVIRKYPGQFVGCLLADPRPNMNGVAELERLIKQKGYRAVRFHPYRWPEGQSMANEVGLLKSSAEVPLPAAIMALRKHASLYLCMPPVDHGR